MHALIVVSHPNTDSLTHAVAARIGAGLVHEQHSFEIADLSAEGFQPAYTTTDIAGFLQQGQTSADIKAEQQRIDQADALVLVYPVYWWSMPGLLKGWVDRVFSRGWAYDNGADGKLIKRLGHLPIHLVALAAGDEQLYARRGYGAAMKTQIEHGIFDYCGAPVMTSVLLTGTHDQPDANLDKAFAIGRGVFATSMAA